MPRFDGGRSLSRRTVQLLFRVASRGCGIHLHFGAASNAPPQPHSLSHDDERAGKRNLELQAGAPALTQTENIRSDVPIEQAFLKQAGLRGCD